MTLYDLRKKIQERIKLCEKFMKKGNPKDPHDFLTRNEWKERKEAFLDDLDDVNIEIKNAEFRLAQLKEKSKMTISNNELICYNLMMGELVLILGKKENDKK